MLEWAVYGLWTVSIGRRWHFHGGENPVLRQVKDQVKVIAPLVRAGTAGCVWSKERKVIGVGSIGFS